jgi:hypothetical protein
VTGGALARDGSRWIATRHRHFLFPVRALAKGFRGKFLEGLRALCAREEIPDDGSLPALLARLRQKDWVVYAKPPFAGPESVLRYLGRYTHRVALSNRRLLRVDGETVTFRYRDSADGHREKTLELPVHEFIRRFLLHVLPRGFVRIRHAGLLANRTRREQIARTRALLQAEPPLPPPADETVCQKLLRIGIGGGVNGHAAPLPHHRAYGSVHGGSES